MSKKRLRKRRKRPRRSRKPAPPAGGIRLTTPEGDEIVFTSARYRHSALEEIRPILQQADDFGLDDDLEAEPDGSFHFPWFETRPGASKPFAPIGKRVLAHLTLTETALEVEAPSHRRLVDCRQRLEQLLGDRIRLVETKAKSAEQALREKPPAEPEEPFIPPPELIAELEEKMLRQWIDDSIPALGGLTPREAVETPEGRQQVLELIEYAGRMQKGILETPGMFAPDYRKVKKMLGLE
ncbi:MAG: antitoxin Xre/MbcA/ParS toxin-binding domain-containing protein [Chloroflexota bacterium]|nr:antitoxin Xre/MbcA/ParS toxin-binding domain-containing protein [Chloroflexota bacterium]